MLDLGALVSGLVTGLREGVEAALIIAIVCAYLGKTGNARYISRVLVGSGLAVALSVVLGIAIFAAVGGLPEPYEQYIEAAMMIVAAAVVTWMLFWMKRQAAGLGGELRSRVDRALTEGGAWGLTLLAFTAVIREGIETAVFLVGQVAAARTEGTAGALGVIVGALAGLAIAVAIGYAVYAGTRRIDLRLFFRWTGVFLIFIAAGLLSRATHELIEIGVITIGSQVAFDLGSILPHDAGIGLFLRALFGYSSEPEVLTLGVWLVYVVVVLGAYLRPARSTTSAAADIDTAAAAVAVAAPEHAPTPADGVSAATS
jgi:high-affinity iron transporter